MVIEVSVIIINYNTPELTEACVRSVLRYTVGSTFEIIVVDNASNVGDLSWLPSLDTRVHYLPQRENLGFAKGNNAGWAIAKGDYILLLNSDTELISDAISLSIDQFRLNPKVGVLSVALQYPDGRWQHPPNAFPRLSTELLVLTRLEKLLTKKDRIKLHYGTWIDPEKYYKPDWLWGAYWMATRQAIAEMPGGKLPEDFFMYMEDTLWGWEVRVKQKREILYAPVAVVIHHISGSSTGSQTEEDKYRTRIFPNEKLFIEKSRGKMYAWIFYFVRMLHHFTLRTQADKEKAQWYFTKLFNI